MDYSESPTSSTSHELSYITTLDRISSTRNQRNPSENEKEMHSMETAGWMSSASTALDLSAYLEAASKQDGEQGVIRREAGVTFQNVTVRGDSAGLKYAQDMSDVLTSPFKMMARLVSKGSVALGAEKIILNNFTGSVRPSEMLLVLGRPGAGCTSLLKVLSCNTSSFASVKGTISYDGLTPEEMLKSFRGDIAYLPEDDVHLPYLTVEQTLRFAAAARTHSAGSRPGQTRSDLVSERYLHLLSLFSLGHSAQTKVGNDLMQGISGGERKRLSIAEMMLTGCKIACHDNSTRGLDSQYALEYCQALRVATSIQHLTSILSVYQCGEAIYSLFDKVAVLYEGHLVYFGPRSTAVDYFQEMGYQPEDRQTSSDFLVAVTDPTCRFVRAGYEGKVPTTAIEFAQYFAASAAGQDSIRQAQEQSAQHSISKIQSYRISARAEHTKGHQITSRYLISYSLQVQLAIARRYHMQMAELSDLAILSVSAVLQALLMGSLYYNLPQTTDGFVLRGTVVFFALLYNCLAGTAEITNAFDVIAFNLVDTPFKILSILPFDFIIYYLTGLQRSPSQFFIFVLFTFVTNLTMVAAFRALAATTRSSANALTYAGLLITVVVVYSGYVIPRQDMVSALRWISYVQPVSYAFEALLANEFRTVVATCDTMIPQGGFYSYFTSAYQVCTVFGGLPGTDLVSGPDYILKTFGFTYDHVWRNFGIICCFLFFFLAINAIAADFQTDETEVGGGVLLFKRSSATQDLKKIEVAIEEELNHPPADPHPASEEKEKEIDSKPKSESRDFEVYDIPAVAPPPSIPRSKKVFSWSNISYDVEVKQGTRRLLSDVSGFVVPGKMTALMGASGAGKTTLLNVLAQRTKSGFVGGSTFVDGRSLPISFRRQTGYCQQQDIHLATSTVREALVFSALLRQPASTSEKEKLAYVEEVIDLLEMSSYAEAIVGEVGFGLNVEQRKRLTIGVELAARPSLLIFLDEPTSGMDGVSAHRIVQLLRKLADHGLAILATIHQPSAEIFQMFDRLLLLKETAVMLQGGETVYFGELGEHSKNVIDYFEQRSELKCGPVDNPAEFILAVLSNNATVKHDDVDWHQSWKASDEYKTAQQLLSSYHVKSTWKRTFLNGSDKHHCAAPYTTQFKLVTKRAFQNYWRSPEYVLSKLALNLLTGIFIGLSFFRSSGPLSISGIRSQVLSLLISAAVASPLAQQLQPKFIMFRTLFETREHDSRFYSWPAAVFASVVVEIPWNIASGTLLFIAWFNLLGYNSSDGSRVVYAFASCMTFQLYYSTFAQATCAITNTTTSAAVVFAAIFGYTALWNGVLLTPSQAPAFFRSWMPLLSPFSYFNGGFLGNALGNGVEVVCKANELRYIQTPFGTDCSEYMYPFLLYAPGYAETVNGRCGWCPFADGDQFLTTLEMTYGHRERDMYIILLYVLSNIAFVFLFTWLVRMYDWKPFRRSVYQCWSSIPKLSSVGDRGKSVKRGSVDVDTGFKEKC